MATQTTNRSSANSNDKPKRTTRTQKEPSNAGSSVGALIGVAAAGVAAGVAAMIGRKVLVQAPTVLSGDWDEALAAEHAATLKVIDALSETTSKHATKRGLLLANLKHMLSKHAFQEENTVYPAMRDAGHADTADDLNKDHGYVKQALYELTKSVKTDDLFLSTLSKLRSDLEEHIHEEENSLFPQLKSVLTEQENTALTRAMNKEGFKLA